MNVESFFDGTGFWGAVGMPNLALPWSQEPACAEPVTGYHVLSTAPYRYRHPGDAFTMRDYAVLTARLSAAAWRRYHGPICLVTDEAGEAWCKEVGLEQVYDDILVWLSDTNQGIRTDKFWASGKILAWQKLPLPCAVIDMDLIVWKPLPLRGNPLAAAHIEYIDPSFYPPFSYFLMSSRYRFPEQWDERVPALNTSLLYMEDEELRTSYTTEAIRFMRQERDTPDDGVRCMVFAEQRILGMCAAAMGIRPKVFLNYDDPLEKQELITHLWSGKRVVHQVLEAEERYNTMCRTKEASLWQEQKAADQRSLTKTQQKDSFRKK